MVVAQVCECETPWDCVCFISKKFLLLVSGVRTTQGSALCVPPEWEWSPRQACPPAPAHSCYTPDCVP